MNKGKIFIISGPSGVGKDTMIKEILKSTDNLEFSISSITRNPRGDEGEKEKYNFISVDEFKKGIDEGAFLEFAEYCGNYYGTPKKPIENWVNNGKNVLIECDVVGKEKLEKILPEAVCVFILPPSVKTLRKRLSKRGTDNAEAVEKRVKAATVEIEKARKYDFLVINDAIEQAVADFQSIIRNEYRPTKSNDTIINEVLNND